MSARLHELHTLAATTCHLKRDVQKLRDRSHTAPKGTMIRPACFVSDILGKIRFFRKVMKHVIVSLDLQTILQINPCRRILTYEGMLFYVYTLPSS